MKIILILLKKDRLFKSLIIIFTDIILCCLSVILSFYLVGFYSHVYGIKLVIIISVLLLFVFKFFKIYSVIIKYINLNITKDLLKGFVVYTFLLILILYVLDFPNVPRSIPSYIHLYYLFYCYHIEYL